MLKEMKWWYASRGRVWRDRGLLAEANTAEELKSHLVAHCPESEAELKVQGSSELDSLWERL